MIAAMVLAATLAQTHVADLLVQRITHVTPPCTVKRAGAATWQHLQAKASSEWNLWPGDHVACSGHGRVTVRAGISTHSYADYIALPSSMGVLGGRYGSALPYGLVGSGLGSKRLLTSGIWSKGGTLAKGSPNLGASKYGTNQLGTTDDLAAMRSHLPKGGVFSGAAADEIAHLSPAGVTAGERAAGDAGGLLREVRGEPAIVVAVIAGLVWLFVAKQWLWLAAAIVAVVILAALKRA